MPPGSSSPREPDDDHQDDGAEADQDGAPERAAAADDAADLSCQHRRRSSTGRHVAGLAVGRELEEAILEALALAPDLGHADAGVHQRAVDRDQALVADVGDLEVERLVALVVAHAGHERDAREHAARALVVVGAQQHGVAAARDQLVDRAPRDQPAGLHDRDVVGHLLHLVEDVRRDEDRAPLLLDERADHVAELEHARGVEPVRRLVEHEQLGVVEQGARDAEALAHAERVGLDLVVRALAQRDALEHRRDARARLAAVVRGPHVEVAAAAQVRVEARLLDDAADARERLADVLRHLAAAQVDAAAARLREAEHHADQRRLAAAVRPEPGEAAPARHVDRDVVDRELLPEALRDVLELDDRVAHRPPPSRPAPVASSRCASP